MKELEKQIPLFISFIIPSDSNVLSEEVFFSCLNYKTHLVDCKAMQAFDSEVNVQMSLFCFILVQL